MANTTGAAWSSSRRSRIELRPEAVANHGIDPALVDFAVLGAWMDGEGLPRGPFERVETLAGGTQNVLLRFARGGRDYVLRRPPPHLRPKSNDALRREAPVLAPPAPTHGPHPGFIAPRLHQAVLGGAVFSPLGTLA